MGFSEAVLAGRARSILPSIHPIRGIRTLCVTVEMRPLVTREMNHLSSLLVRGNEMDDDREDRSFLRRCFIDFFLLSAAAAHYAKCRPFVSQLVGVIRFNEIRRTEFKRYSFPAKNSRTEPGNRTNDDAPGGGKVGPVLLCLLLGTLDAAAEGPAGRGSENWRGFAAAVKQ